MTINAQIDFFFLGPRERLFCAIHMHMVFVRRIFWFHLSADLQRYIFVNLVSIGPFFFVLCFIFIYLNDFFILIKLHSSEEMSLNIPLIHSFMNVLLNKILSPYMFSFMTYNILKTPCWCWARCELQMEAFLLWSFLLPVTFCPPGGFAVRVQALSTLTVSSQWKLPSSCIHEVLTVKLSSI